MCIHTRLENCVLPNRPQLGSAENSFFDLSKFEAMKSLSSWEAACSDKDKFCAKMKSFLIYHLLTSGLNEERITKMAL